MDSKSTPRVVVVGAGFGGLNAARVLARYSVHVTLVDRKNRSSIKWRPLVFPQVKSRLRSAGFWAVART